MGSMKSSISSVLLNSLQGLQVGLVDTDSLAYATWFIQLVISSEVTAYTSKTLG